MCIFSFFRKINIERNTKVKLIAYIQRHNVLQDVTNRSFEVGFHKAKKKERKELERMDEEFFDPLYNVRYVG